MTREATTTHELASNFTLNETARYLLNLDGKSRDDAAKVSSPYSTDRCPFARGEVSVGKGRGGVVFRFWTLSGWGD